MPTYEYRCPKGHEFELFQRMSDEPKAECPECGAQAERMLSAGAGFLFKGEGFYITDYRSDSYREAAKKEQKGAASGDSAGDGSGAKKDGASTSTGKDEGAGKKGGGGSGGGKAASGGSAKKTGSD